MKKILLALSLALFSVGSAAAESPAPSKPAPAKPAPRFPVPKDATGGESQPGGGGKILMYKIPRGRDAVIAEMKETFKKEGWKVIKDDASPSGRAARMEVEKDGASYKVSFVGDATQSALILTLP
ncbi:MAG: hypothetical protein KF773_13765 [Deltaproteobacteria bacterium]|nr:hypothetical protein [Deltaproteobacteria bacterium]